jgi:sulfotransferase family protein
VEATHAEIASSVQGASAGALPNLAVIGAQKCGTTALNYYLDLHPEIAMSREVGFFVERQNWSRGVEWYRRLFDATAPVRGDHSPNYTMYPHDLGVAERMQAVIPDAKLIYMVRDPLKRIEAHWVHNYAQRRDRGDFVRTIMHPNATYLVRSQYFMQLGRFLQHYDRSQILVLEQQDLLERRRVTLRRVFEFLGVTPDFEHPGFDSLRHQTRRKRRASKIGRSVQALRHTRVGSHLPRPFWSALFALDRLGTGDFTLRRPIERPNLKEILEPEILDALRDDAKRLQEFTGRRFESWSIWA